MGYMSFANAAIFHPVSIAVAKKKRAKKAAKAKFVNDCIGRGASYPQAMVAFAKHEAAVKARNKAKYLKAKRVAKKNRLAKKEKARHDRVTQGSDRNPDQGTSSQET